MPRREVCVGFAFCFLFASFSRINAAEVEMHHPKGWTFTMPKGDPVKGRTVFDKFSCYSRHEVRGEKFLLLDKDQAVGPDPLERRKQRKTICIFFRLRFS